MEHAITAVKTAVHLRYQRILDFWSVWTSTRNGAQDDQSITPEDRGQLDVRTTLSDQSQQSTTTNRINAIQSRTTHLARERSLAGDHGEQLSEARDAIDGWTRQYLPQLKLNYSELVHITKDDSIRDKLASLNVPDPPSFSSIHEFWWPDIELRLAPKNTVLKKDEIVAQSTIPSRRVGTAKDKEKAVALWEKGYRTRRAIMLEEEDSDRNPERLPGDDEAWEGNKCDIDYQWAHSRTWHRLKRRYTDYAFEGRSRQAPKSDTAAEDAAEEIRRKRRQIQPPEEILLHKEVGKKGLDDVYIPDY
ncbi:hypothetical protein EJ08DRAFT_663525 [Tothia fuscella]|uniref:Uncharacterized protein n=1 Tax=Tothia fuscella TaxID=1048955 RepID=A0A9P4TVD4_9PEZI|nr:hypothetical protein EJ08DRAFT_663525 [Tothia fuscella]